MLQRTLYHIVAPISRLYWFIARPKTQGVKCLILYREKVLLIRNTYGKGHWTLPGGGVKRGESSEDAVRREIKEEVGITLTRVTPLGVYQTQKEYKQDTVYCFSAEVLNEQFIADWWEIKDAAWFPLHNLPQPLSPAVPKVLVMYKK